jgi:ATP-dependent Clp protease ATP-binding subunit ClpC
VTAPIADSAPLDLQAREALAVAQDEARRLGHDYVGTEHLLLGVLSMFEQGGAAVLRNCDLDRARIRQEIERLIQAPSPTIRIGALPLTPRALEALRRARTEAECVGLPLVNAQHLLLGLLSEGQGVAILALKNLGVRIDQLRQATFGTT